MAALVDARESHHAEQIAKAVCASGMPGAGARAFLRGAPPGVEAKAGRRPGKRSAARVLLGGVAAAAGAGVGAGCHLPMARMLRAGDSGRSCHSQSAGRGGFLGERPRSVLPASFDQICDPGWRLRAWPRSGWRRRRSDPSIRLAIRRETKLPTGGFAGEASRSTFGDILPESAPSAPTVPAAEGNRFESLSVEVVRDDRRRTSDSANEPRCAQEEVGVTWRHAQACSGARTWIAVLSALSSSAGDVVRDAMSATMPPLEPRRLHLPCTSTRRRQPF